MPYGRRTDYKRTAFRGTSGRSTLAKARQKNARAAQTTMRRTQATAKVAQAALRLARANRERTFGNVQRGLYRVELPNQLSKEYPACFLMTAMHAPTPAHTSNGLPLNYGYPATVGGTFSVDSSTRHFLTPSLDSLTQDVGQEKFNQWASCNGQEPENLFKWDYMTLTFVVDFSMCRDVHATYRIDFIKKKIGRFERPSSTNDMTLPDSLCSFNHLVKDFNSINSEHWTHVRKPVYIHYKPNAGDIMGPTKVAKTVYFKKPGNQKRGIMIDSQGTQPGFSKGNEYLEMPMKEMIWCVISTDIPYVFKKSDGAGGETTVTKPTLGIKCQCQWRDNQGIAS